MDYIKSTKIGPSIGPSSDRATIGWKLGRILRQSDVNASSQPGSTNPGGEEAHPTALFSTADYKAPRCLPTRISSLSRGISTGEKPSSSREKNLGRKESEREKKRRTERIGEKKRNRFAFLTDLEIGRRFARGTARKVV